MWLLRMLGKMCRLFMLRVWVVGVVILLVSLVICLFIMLRLVWCLFFGVMRIVLCRSRLRFMFVFVVWFGL